MAMDTDIFHVKKELKIKGGNYNYYSFLSLPLLMQDFIEIPAKILTYIQFINK